MYYLTLLNDAPFLVGHSGEKEMDEVVELQELIGTLDDLA